MTFIRLNLVDSESPTLAKVEKESFYKEKRERFKKRLKKRLQMDKYNCSFGRYYNSEPVVNSRLEKIKKSKVLRSLRRGFCGASDDEDICEYTNWTVRLKVYISTLIYTRSVCPPNCNCKCHSVKTLGQVAVDLALLTANANQLRYLLVMEDLCKNVAWEQLQVFQGAT